MLLTLEVLKLVVIHSVHIFLLLKFKPELSDILMIFPPETCNSACYFI